MEDGRKRPDGLEDGRKRPDGLEDGRKRPDGGAEPQPCDPNKMDAICLAKLSLGFNTTYVHATLLPRRFAVGSRR
jgi:hypothetical protein